MGTQNNKSPHRNILFEIQLYYLYKFLFVYILFIFIFTYCFEKFKIV